MRSRVLLVLLLLLAATPALAHPGVGIVRDRLGNVYYTDLVHVWRIAPDGRKSIAVRDVHTHELAIDSAGVLYGEDNRYLGGDRYRHRIWRRTPDGRVEDVIPWRDGFWREYGFVRDANGATYWASCPERVCTIHRRAPDGLTSAVVPRTPLSGTVQWLAPAPGGELFVLDAGALKRLGPTGELRTLTAALGSAPMGMWPEPDTSVLVAVYGRRAVICVAPSGKITTVARVPAPWGPSGVLRAPDGALWILEYSTANEARVRRVTAAGRTTVY